MTAYRRGETPIATPKGTLDGLVEDQLRHTAYHGEIKANLKGTQIERWADMQNMFIGVDAWTWSIGAAFLFWAMTLCGLVFMIVPAIICTLPTIALGGAAIGKILGFFKWCATGWNTKPKTAKLKEYGPACIWNYRMAGYNKLPRREQHRMQWELMGRLIGIRK